MTADVGETTRDTDAGANVPSAAPAAGALQTYLDPMSGRHYTQRPDGSSRWLTAAEEATLAWRATALPAGDVEAEVDDRPRARTTRSVPARHAGPFDDLALRGPRADPGVAAPHPSRTGPAARSHRTVRAAVAGGVLGLLVGAGVGVVADLPGEPAPAGRAAAAAPGPTVTVPGPVPTTTVEVTVTRTVTAPRRKRTAATSPDPARPTAAATAGASDPRFDTCRAARAQGYGPYRRGTDPEYGWYPDRDDDGVVCD